MSSLSATQKANMLGQMRDRLGDLQGRVGSIAAFLEWDEEEEASHPFSIDFLNQLHTDIENIRSQIRILAADLEVEDEKPMSKPELRGDDHDQG